MIRASNMFKSLSTQIFYNNIYTKVPLAPTDPILGVNQAYISDTDSRKVNLGVGAYRDDNGKPYIFKIVKKVEKEIIADESLNKEYLPIDGIPGFNSSSQKLVLGADNPAVKEGRIVTVQTLSGTGSLRIGFEFVKQELPGKVLVSNPTWANHHSIIQRARLQFDQYPYYDAVTKQVKMDQYIDFLNSSAEGSIVLMHACAHNPTGVDPTENDWKRIAEVIKKKNHVPYFDTAYQGFASGDIIKDASSIRFFLDQGFSMLVSQSYAKNMGLYGERVGALHVVTPDRDSATRVLSQLKMIIRASISSPPIHGARIVERVLSKPENFAEWQSELHEVANRIITMRKALRARLEDIKTPGTWNHITDQIGMFSYTGLNEKQVVDCLVKKHHIHLVKNGRISMAGLNSKNVNYVADAINDAVKNVK